MKKKFIYGLLVIAVLFVITGCTEKKKEEKKEEDTKTIEYKDIKTGYTTKFTCGRDSGYEVKDQDGSGKYLEITLANKRLNMEVEIYYTDTYTGGYEKAKENRKDSDGFKEYNWGKYSGYIYNVDDDSLYFDILLDDKGERDTSLFGSFEVDNDAKVLDVFDGESFQNLLKSMNYEKPSEN